MRNDFQIGMHAIVYIYHNKENKNSEEIAKNICVNAVNVRQVMKYLVDAKLICKKEGKNGGYLFQEALGNIKLSQIYHALSFKFMELNKNEKEMDAACVIASGMKDVMNHLLDVMERDCIKYLEHKTIKEIEYELIQRRKD